MSWDVRPAPALCMYCWHHPARLNKRHPHMATMFCSDEHKWAYHRHMKDDERTALANRVRQLLGMEMGRGRDFTRPEMHRIIDRLERILPPSGITKSTGYKRDRYWRARRSA